MADFGGHIRPANRKEDRIDRRKAKYQNGRRRVVVALRECNGRTVTHVVNSESEGVQIANNSAVKGSTSYADESAHWDALHMNLDVLRINHSEANSNLDGTHTNNVESFFARLRRMVQGQHHHVSHKYLYQYANHATWMEDHCRRSNGAKAFSLLGASLEHPVSRTWKGYWQREAQ